MKRLCRIIQSLTLVVPGLFLIGCGPADFDWEGEARPAREVFEDDVSPIVDSKCSSCHANETGVDGPDFLGTRVGDYYATLTGNRRFVNHTPANSMLLLKGSHEGPAFNELEVQVVQRWLTMEAQERNLKAPAVESEKPKTIDAALNRFGNCMTETDWYDSEMDRLADEDTLEGPCYSCHNTGTAGAFLSDDPDETFEMNRQRPYVLKLVQGTVDAEGGFSGLIPAWRFRDKGDECDAADQVCHPEYLLDDDREDALQEFVARTLDRYENYDAKCE